MVQGLNAVPIQMDAELLAKSAYKARKAVLEADLDDIWSWSSLQLQSEWGIKSVLWSFRERLKNQQLLKKTALRKVWTPLARLLTLHIKIAKLI